MVRGAGRNQATGPSSVSFITGDTSSLTFTFMRSDLISCELNFKASTNMSRDLIKLKIYLEFYFFKFLFIYLFLLFRATPVACESSQARGQIGAAAAGLHQSHSNTGSELCLQPIPQLRAMLDP